MEMINEQYFFFVTNPLRSVRNIDESINEFVDRVYTLGLQELTS